MEYDNNVRATFHTNHNAGIPERRMYILGSEGTIRADVLTGTIESQRIGFDTELVTHETGASGGHGGGDQIMAEEFKDCILHGTPPAAGLDEGLASAVTCLGIDQAMTTGSVVDMTPFWAKVDG
jgi:predicted dehydrogenase